jgi:hypothetical protein
MVPAICVTENDHAETGKPALTELSTEVAALANLLGLGFKIDPQ